jgi:hypothetical protein
VSDGPEQRGARLLIGRWSGWAPVLCVDDHDHPIPCQYAILRQILRKKELSLGCPPARIGGSATPTLLETLGLACGLVDQPADELPLRVGRFHAVSVEHPNSAAWPALGGSTPFSRAPPMHAPCQEKTRGHVRSIAKLDGVSPFLDQPLVFIVRTDPEPNHFISFDRAEGTVVSRDSRGMNVPLGLDLLEPEPRVTRILPKSSIRLPRLFLYLRGQSTKGLAKATSG